MAENMGPPIGIAFPSSAPKHLVGEFISALLETGVEVGEHEIPDGMQYRAGVEWLVPTLFAIYVTKSYFEGFLQAVAEDHYAALKRASSKFLCAVRNTPYVILGRNRVPDSNDYSRIISMVYNGHGLRTFRLLFSVDATEGEIYKAIVLFTQFAEADVAGHEHTEVVKLDDAIAARFPGTPRILAFDRLTGKLKELDPIPKERRENG